MSGARVLTRPVTPGDAAAWDAFVLSRPDSSPFHLLGWSRALAEALGHIECHLLAERHGDIVGVLPLVEVDSALTGSRLVSTPLAGYGGPLATDAAVADTLVARAFDLTRTLAVGHLELHFESEERVPERAEQLPGSDRYCGFHDLLPAEPEALIDWLPRKSRRMVRLGERAGLVGRLHRLDDPQAPTPPWLTAAHRLVAATMRDLGTPSYSLSMLRALLLERPGDWFVWALWDGARMAAAVWVARHGDGLFPHFSGAHTGYRKVGVNNLLYASLMQAGIREGVRRFDFGRSKVDSGPYHFKRHFGFEPRPLGYRYYLGTAADVPTISPNNPRYALAIRLWQRLPLPVTRALGPVLVGHFA